MENLNAEQVKKALERDIRISIDLNYECPRITYSKLREALALINSQEQRIKELTQAHEMLSESYDHLEKTKDELLAERSRLTEENEKIGIENFDLICELSRIKEDIVREMQERLKAHFDSDSDYFRSSHGYIRSVVDQTAKEVVEET